MLGVLTFTAYKATLIEFLHFPLATAFLCGEIAWGAALLTCLAVAVAPDFPAAIAARVVVTCSHTTLSLCGAVRRSIVAKR